jgi:hypothetical protein
VRLSWMSLKTKVVGFPGLCLITGSYGLVILPIKSSRRFLGLGLKTKWAMVCQLCHKTDGRMKTAWDTSRDLAACFAWKRVGLGFPSFASKQANERRRVVHVASSRRSHGSEAEDGQFDGVRCSAVEVGPKYPSLAVNSFSTCRGILVFWLDL